MSTQSSVPEFCDSTITNLPPISTSRKRKAPIVTKRKRGGIAGGSDPISIETLIQYRKEQNLSYSDIARIVGCTAANVRNRLASEGLLIDVDHVARARKVRADVLTMKGMQVVEHMTESKLAKAPLRDLAVAFNIMHQAERLELGKSTSNVSYAQMLVAGQDDEEKLKVIEAEIVSRETL